MRVFKTRVFAGTAHKWHIGESALWHAATHAAATVTEADLGGEVLLLRLRRAPETARSLRTFTCLRAGLRAIFLHGLAKNERSDLKRDELAAMWKLAKLMLNHTDRDLAAAMHTGALIEVADDQTVS